MAVELKLQATSDEMEFGTIVRWLKSEGDSVVAGEVVVEVETEKVTNELEAPVTGVLERIVAVEGDEIRAGATIAIFAENG
jgi:pyruvate/2-oxoglutarate dehydrogenase complex dihydrolipoamide acyltransferase (E2) component